MHPVVTHIKYSSEGCVNDEVLDLLLEINTNENASVSSRRSSNECHVSSNMDHDDLWEVTILPSLSSQATSSNDTLRTSVKVLHTVNEHETKRGSYSSIDGRKRGNEGTHKIMVRPKVAASPTYEKLNHGHSHRSLNWDKRSSSALLRDEKELDDRTGEKLSSTRYGVCEDTDECRAPFIELGAVNKVLNFITDSDPKVSSLTNNCCNKISRTLQYLIALRRDKKLNDLLSNDSSLYRCERCGVISHMLKSYPVVEGIERNRTRVVQDVNIVTAERDCINYNRNTEKLQISMSHSSLNHNARSRISIDNRKLDRRAEYKGELSEAELLPVKERSFVIRSHTESPNDANNISVTESDANVKIKNTPHLNNSSIKKLFADYEAARRDTRCKSNCATRNDRFCRVKPSATTKVCRNIDKETVVRKISYENKSQFADLRSKNIRKSQGQRQFLEKDEDNFSVDDTVKYLARGQFTILGQEENDLLSKLQDRRHIRLEGLRNRQSSVLYASRDDYPRCHSGFWLFDKSGHLPEVALDEYCFLPMPNGSMDNNSNNFRAHNMRKNQQKQSDSWAECVEKDSLENCVLLERNEESDTMTFSSSENLMYELPEALGGKDDSNDTDRDISLSYPLVSSRPLLDIAQHVRAEIAEAKRSKKAKESMNEARMCDSDALETRNKLYHSIEKMVISNTKTSMIHPKNNSTIYALNRGKLARSESNNVTLIHSDKSFKVNNEMTSTWLDDCIPTKLSELREDKSSLIEGQDNVVEMCSEVNKSKDSIKISHEYSTSAVSADKLEKTRNKLSDDCSRNITRRIVYKNVLPENIDSEDKHIVLEISPVYREILESSENMDWDDFRELIKSLHPDQKEFWNDICKTVNEEATRSSGDANDSMEVCIEISPIIFKNLKTDKPTAGAREIAFELDMTMKNVEHFLNKRQHLAEERLDAHKSANEGVTN